ncbi:MAG: hypothetical protein P1U56_22715 [Saprospiraceae bacterium]|nr:hypothetical protein [Saprospiraceae bacterium]
MQSAKFTINLENKTLTACQFEESSYLLDDRTFLRKDTTYIYYEKTFKIPEQSFNEFLNTVNTNPFDSTLTYYKDILDGISYRIHTIYSNQDSLTLASNNSSRNDKSILAYAYFDAFFELVQSMDNDYQDDYIIEGIKEYFDYEKSVKNFERSIEKVSDNPLEYRLWFGSFDCDSTAFLIFLEELPEYTPILFDLRNEKFPLCYEKIISERNDKKEFYYYGSMRIQELDEDMNWVKEAIEHPKEKLHISLTPQEAKEILMEDLKIKNELNRLRIFGDRAEAMAAMENKI